MAEGTAGKLLLTYAEAAEALGIGTRKLWQLCHDGHIRTVAIGRAVRVPAAELDRFIAARLDEAEKKGGAQ